MLLFTIQILQRYRWYTVYRYYCFYVLIQSKFCQTIPSHLCKSSLHQSWENWIETLWWNKVWKYFTKLFTKQNLYSALLSYNAYFNSVLDIEWQFVRPICLYSGYRCISGLSLVNDSMVELRFIQFWIVEWSVQKRYLGYLMW